MTSTESIQAIDSLSAHEFQVEVGGEVASGIFGVSGLHSFSMDDGEPVLHPVTITKMVQQDPNLPFNKWTRETISKLGDKVTRKVAVVAMDEGTETRRWVIEEAWIVDIQFSDFDTGSDALVEERITLYHNGVNEIWP